MRSPYALLRFVLAAVATLVLTGCLFRPAAGSGRRFVLAPLAAAPTNNAASVTKDIPVGVGLVKMPPYLHRSSLLLRKGTNEIEYFEESLWAEPLDQGFQRTLAANLSRLLPTEQVYLSTWKSEQVKLRIFINIERFDIDKQGSGRLTAWWRLALPLGDTPVKSGQVNFTRKMVPPGTDPAAIVATLSELNADFSRLLAEAIRDAIMSQEPRK